MGKSESAGKMIIVESDGSVIFSNGIICYIETGNF